MNKKLMSQVALRFKANPTLARQCAPETIATIAVSIHDKKRPGYYGFRDRLKKRFEKVAGVQMHCLSVYRWPLKCREAYLSARTEGEEARAIELFLKGLIK